MREFLNILIIEGLEKDLKLIEDRIVLLGENNTASPEGLLLAKKKEEIKKRLISIIGS